MKKSSEHTGASSDGNGGRERRRFERLQLSEDAVALNAEGKELGRVSQAGGGGFLIFPADPEAVRQLTVGNRLTVTVVEPRSQARNTLDVEVRYRKGAAMGVQFTDPANRPR